MASQHMPGGLSSQALAAVPIRGTEIPARQRTVAEFIPVLRPRLPSAAEILAYLQEIDRRQWYSNHGPLVSQLEERLSAHLRMPETGVVTVANATAGITAALLAREVEEGSYCIVPSWTFVATPHAIRGAGLVPYFRDVDRDTWALNPAGLADSIKHVRAKVRAVVVVSPFGAPLDVEAWQAFEGRTGIAVVIDAAAGFDTVRPSRIPSVVSLHATKILGAGEGGFIATTDRRLLDRIRACCNFGFHGSRSALMPAMNAKMSEYHAAVALAALDDWPLIRARHMRITGWYRRWISAAAPSSLQPEYGDGWATGTTSVVLPQNSAEIMAGRLLRENIETRAWWGRGCHVQPAFAECPRGPLPITDDLGGRVLGVPHFPDMGEGEVQKVVGALKQALISPCADSGTPENNTRARRGRTRSARYIAPCSTPARKAILDAYR